MARRWRPRAKIAGDVQNRGFLRLFDGHPVLAVFVGLFALGWAVTYWWLLLLGAAVFCDWKAWQQYRLHVGQQEARAAAVAARADWEHQQFLAGNSVGWYGQYPPAR